MSVPRVWCEACGLEMQPAQVVLERCPHCGEPITYVVVDPATARERERVAPVSLANSVPQTEILTGCDEISSIEFAL